MCISDTLAGNAAFIILHGGGSRRYHGGFHPGGIQFDSESKFYILRFKTKAVGRISELSSLLILVLHTEQDRAAWSIEPITITVDPLLPLLLIVWRGLVRS